MAKEEAAAEKEKIAIIKGASSGIGKTTAIALAKVGNKVVLAARRDNGIPFRETIEAALKGARIEYKHLDADRTDLFDTLRALSSIIMAEKNNLIYVNVSVGSKIQAIASMMACMMFEDSVAMMKPIYNEFPD